MKKLLYILLFVPVALFGQSLYWDPTPTSGHATILIMLEEEISFNGNPINDGALIGVFYEDDGVLRCGGFTPYISGETMQFAAWEDDATTGEIDGFAQGSEYIWYINIDGNDYPAVATYFLENSFTSFYGTNNLSKVTYFTIYNTEDEIEGCTNSLAFNFDENALFDDGSCISVQDMINSIDSLQTEIITLNDEATTSLSSLQQALDTWNTIIDLSSGWNMIGYGCPNPIDLVEGLSNHTESIIITKDNNGNVYMPEFGFNGIGGFTPGFGYQIKLTEAIEGFSLCDWYVNDIPEDNIVSLQEEVEILQAFVDSVNAIGCTDSEACNFDIIYLYEDGSCEYLEQGYDCDGNITEYFVGMEAEGGIVFYIDETSEHGLVAAMEDLEGVENDNYTMVWGCYGTTLPGADGTAIGTGYQNTLDIVSGCSETPIAASEALAYQANGFDDWYLPSKDELVEMYNTIGQGGQEGNIGGFENTWYWSSSQYYSTYVWGVAFLNGIAGENSENNPNRVRPIRSF